jgi:hypothetical protein
LLSIFGLVVRRECVDFFPSDGARGIVLQGPFDPFLWRSSMKSLRWFGAALLAAALAAPSVRAQEPPKPGPEQEVLKKWVGNWDCTVKMMGTESKGAATYKMDLGGMWLVSAFDGDFGGMKFSGREMATFDPAKKKYSGVWCDSFNTSPMLLEGTFDKDKKTLTWLGEGPGQDGKMTKYKEVVEWKDDDNFVFNMYPGDAKDPMFTIAYKRKK